MYSILASKKSALVSFLSISSATGLALPKRSISYTTSCDAGRAPNWDGCQAAFNAIGAKASDNPAYEWTFEYPYNCQIFSGTNCVVGICSLEDYQSVSQNLVVDAINDLQTDCQPAGAGGTATDTDGSMEVTIYANSGNPSKAKRDNTWTTAYTIANDGPEQYRQQIQDALPSGSSWTLTSSETQTNMVQVSVSISEDLFDIFKSSQDISYSYTETVTTSETTTIPVNCDENQTGYLYWYPQFTVYHGGYSDGPDGINIYIPEVRSDGKAQGTYQRVCVN